MTLKAQSDQYSPLNRFITEKRHIPTHIILLVILSTLILFLSPAPLYSGLFQPFSPHLTVNEIPSSLVFGSDLRDAEVSKPPVTHSGTGATTALPFSGFIQNLGQVSDNTIEYYYSSNGLSVGFCASRISFVSKVSEDQQPIQFAFTFPGSDSVSPVGRNKNSHYTNYFYGDLQLTNVPSWQELWYYDLYSGIDLRYYMSDQGLKYDFVVHPEADPTQINLRVSESMVLAIGEQTVTIQSKDQPGCIQFQDTTLQVWQTDGTSISSHFVPKDANLNTYGFRVDHFDPTQSLIIDPLLLSFSTYLGGNGYDVGVDIAVDAAGNSYITGQTTSHNFPLMNPNQNTFGGTGDVFVTKLNATGSGLVFSTYLGGSGEDGASGIAVDSAGDSYITGRTYSTDFPVTSNAYQNTYRGGYGDGFVTKLNATGNGLVFSTYLGGSDYEKGRGIAVDITGNTYITGLTYSSDFPVQHAYQNTFGGYQDAFVTKLNGTGTGLAFSTYLGGSDNEYGYDIAVDAAGNSYITGSTDSDDFPVTSNAYQSAKNGGDDAFVTKLSSKGNKLSFSTYLGGSSSDEASGITVDADGNICITGHTYSMDFPVTANAYQSTYREWGDILVAKFNATGNGLVFSTFLGGNGYDVGVDIAVDAAGNTYITGHTYSEDFPVTANTYQSTYGGGSYDAFMTKLSSKGNKLDFSTYLGGNETDGGGGIAVDAARNTYITGVTKRDFPVTANAYQSTHGGGSFDAFVIKFSYSGFFYPTGGETLTGTVAVQWTAVQDASGILYSLFYSSDAGTSWYALAVDYSETMYAWDTTTVPDGSGYLLKVIAINATGHTTEYISDNTFSIQNTPSSSVTPSSAHTSESGIPTTASPGWTVGIFLTLILTIFFYRKYKRRNQESS